MSEQWGTLIDSSNQEWHLHWALESRGDIEEHFPVSEYNYKVILDDTRGMNNNPHNDSVFATYILRPLNMQNSQLITPNFYLFYLTVPSYCKIHRY